MKLTKNEKTFLETLIKNPSASNVEIAEKLNITTQGVGKLRKNIDRKGIISRFETILDYEKMDIKFFALTLVKIMPKAFRKYKKEIEDVLSHPNIIALIKVPQTKITNIILFGFRNVTEYDTFFMTLQSKLPGLIEIKESYVFSNESFIKNSPAELFINVIREHGEEKISKPRPPEIEQNK